MTALAVMVIACMACLAAYMLITNRWPNLWPRRRWYLMPADGIGVTVGPFWTRGGAIDARRRILTWNITTTYDLVRR